LQFTKSGARSLTWVENEWPELEDHLIEKKIKMISYEYFS